MGEYHVVRSSERSAKRKCTRAWHLQWREGWEPIVVPQALEFGTAVHAGMQAIYEPSLWDNTVPSQKLLRAIEAFRECCDEQYAQYLRDIGERRDDYVVRVELGEKMLENYVLNIHPERDAGLRPVKVEVKFSVPILDESGRPLRCWNRPACGQQHENGAEIRHEGRVDAILEDLVRGGYYLLDWKTVGGRKAIDGEEKNTNRFSNPSSVWRNDQLNVYCWALRHVLHIDVRGFILAELRKDYPRLPAKLARRRNGGLYSTNKNQSTTLDVFSKFVREHDQEGIDLGAYDEYLDYLGGPEAPRFHERFRVERSPRELGIVGENLLKEVRAMIGPIEEFAEPIATVCDWCAYSGPCEMMMKGLDAVYTLNSGFRKSTGES
jgi:hypothetical protein